MRYYYWDAEKNKKLVAQRNISFEEIVLNLEQGNLLDDLERPNQEKYNNQRMLIVKVRDYAYLVPYVEQENGILLKTIIPNRKATKEYLDKGEV